MMNRPAPVPAAMAAIFLTSNYLDVLELLLGNIELEQEACSDNNDRS